MFLSPMFCIVLFCLAFHVSFILTSTIMGQLCWPARDVVKFRIANFVLDESMFFRIASLRIYDRIYIPTTPNSSWTLYRSIFGGSSLRLRRLSEKIYALVQCGTVLEMDGWPRR